VHHLISATATLTWATEVQGASLKQGRMLPLLLLRYRRVRALNTSATIFILSANACLYLCGPGLKLDWTVAPWAPAACCLLPAILTIPATSTSYLLLYLLILRGDLTRLRLRRAALWGSTLQCQLAGISVDVKMWWPNLAGSWLTGL